MTASATPETQRHCQDAGMNYFLSKPVAAARLYDVLEKISAAKHPDLVASPGEQVSAGQPPDGA
jgi:CheY-like chemotaxis protein